MLDRLKESLRYVRIPFLLAVIQTIVIFSAFMYARANLSHLLDGHIAGAFGLLPVAFVLATWWLWFAFIFLKEVRGDRKGEG